MNVDTNDNFKYVPDILKSIKESDKDILNMYYGTASGKFKTYPNVKMPDGYDSTTRPWYKQALEHKGEVIITPPYKDAVTGNNVVAIARTVEKNGKVIGVVGMDCSLATLADRISTKKVGTTGYVFISDVNGNVIAHPTKGAYRYRCSL